MLDARKELMIGLLIQGENITTIAKKINISRNSIYEWKKDQEVISEMEERQKEIVSQGNRFIVNNLQTHIEKLHTLAMNSKDNRTAATCLMYLVDKCLKTTNTDKEEDNDRMNIDVLDDCIREIDKENNLNSVK